MRIAAATSLALLLGLCLGCDAYAQAIDIAPLVAPPVPKVQPPATPEVLRPAAPAAPPSVEVPPGLPVHVDDVRVDGVTVYDQASVRPLYADLIGQTVRRERLQAATEALQTRYRQDGYILSVVTGGAEHRDGKLIFVIRVAEGAVTKVNIDGDIGPVGELARDILGHLTLIQPINNADLERYLLLVNDIPGVAAQGVLRPGNDPGTVELVAKVKRQPVTAQVQFDNRGSQELGPYEGLITAQSNAFTTIGEQIEGLFFTTFNREQLFGQLNLSGFLNSDGLKGRLYMGRGNVQPGGALTGTGFDGDLAIAGGGLSYPLIRSRRLNLSADTSFDTYDSSISTFAAGGLASETHLRIMRFGGSVDYQDEMFLGLPAGNSANLKVSHGLNGLGASGNNAALPARAGNRVDFTKLSGEFTRVQSLFSFGDSSVALKSSLGGQFSNDILPPSEQYLLGGVRYGRGFYVGQVSGDRALGATVELQLNTGWADLSPIAANHRLDVQFYGFFDYGRVYNLGPLGVDRTIDSVGLGARSDVTPWLFAELEGLRRLTTHPTGAAATKLSNYAVFTRLVARY